MKPRGRDVIFGFHFTLYYGQYWPFWTLRPSRAGMASEAVTLVRNRSKAPVLTLGAGHLARLLGAAARGDVWPGSGYTGSRAPGPAAAADSETGPVGGGRRLRWLVPGPWGQGTWGGWWPLVDICSSSATATCSVAVVSSSHMSPSWTSPVDYVGDQAGIPCQGSRLAYRLHHGGQVGRRP